MLRLAALSMLLGFRPFAASSLFGFCWALLACCCVVVSFLSGCCSVAALLLLSLRCLGCCQVAFSLLSGSVWLLRCLCFIAACVQLGCWLVAFWSLFGRSLVGRACGFVRPESVFILRRFPEGVKMKSCVLVVGGRRLAPRTASVRALPVLHGAA